ncbi:triacylglycerol lipase [Martiniozyma asiatica (nom. inval.)]|nr:triacylglycerol lipase [Martiniozyma asiatica]
MSDVKVTYYDFGYLQSNPFENITENILTGAIDKVDVDTVKISTPVAKDYQSGFFKWCWCVTSSFLGTFESTEEEKKAQKQKFEHDYLKAKQSNAVTYNEWLSVSLALDKIEGKEKWKSTKESDLYDWELLEKQLNKMKEYRGNGNYEKLLYIIRTSWKRDFAGINNEELYKHSNVGTKHLIENYISECELCLNALASSECTIDDRVLLDVLIETKRNYGRAAITMSGGGAFGLIGVGLFSTLLEADVFPKIVSGSSGGSIVSSIVCSKNSDEIIDILSKLFDHEFQVFTTDEDSDTFYTHLSRLLKYGVWFDSKYLQNTMQEFLGNITFREAFNKTGRILNITVSPELVHDQPTLLNYLTSPNVLVWSAVCASCALPFVFASSTIYEKNMETGEIEEWSNPSLKFVDGSLNSDLPITRLSEMFNVNHVIACQVNPHVTPLVRFASECLDITNAGLPWKIKRYFWKFASLLSYESIHYLNVLSEFGICENLATKLKHMLSQSYSGDITILPDLYPSEFDKTLSNPSPSFVWDCILKGARGTWPKLSIIYDQLKVEFLLDKYISMLKSKVVFGDEYSNLALDLKKGIRTSSSMMGLNTKKKVTRPSSSSVTEYTKVGWGINDHKPHRRLSSGSSIQEIIPHGIKKSPNSKFIAMKPQRGSHGVGLKLDSKEQPRNPFQSPKKPYPGYLAQRLEKIDSVDCESTEEIQAGNISPTKEVLASSYYSYYETGNANQVSPTNTGQFSRKILSSQSLRSYETSMLPESTKRKTSDGSIRVKDSSLGYDFLGKSESKLDINDINSIDKKEN